jgi:16S rRNA (cytosine1402-N4)-methyltransferase
MSVDQDASVWVHAPVLIREVIEGLSPRDGKVFVDGTLGGAGHTRALLATPGVRVIGIDRDLSALAAARDSLGPLVDRATLIHGQFGDMPQLLADLNVRQVDGILADLGVSSPQLDRADRGFSFTRAGPIDMRMDPTRGQTALDLIHDTDVESLGEVIKELGEERHGMRIARLIKDAAKEQRLHTTLDLAAVIASGIPAFEQRKSKIHPATRTFQALRIAVNAELAELERLLDAFPDLLVPGGRCAIISFHSLEDRLVKNRFRDLAWTTSLPPRLATQAGERIEAVCVPVTRKAVFAADDEVERNPRARSARLRICERTAAPNVASGAPGSTRRS